MQFQIRTAVEFFGVAAYLLAAFAVIGAPVKLLLNAIGITVHRAVSSMMLGIALIVVVSWYWAAPFDGTKPVPRILLVVGLLVGLVRVIFFLRRRGAVGELVRDPRVRDAAALFAVVVVAMTAVTLINDTQFFTRDGLTTFSLGNNDAASYAVEAQHLLDHGPDDSGNIVASDIGARSMQFSNGGYAVLASASSLTGQDVWKTMQVTMFVTLVMSAYAIALLLRAIWPRGPAVALGVAAVVGFGVPYTTYTVGHWFYSQTAAIGVAVSIIAVVFAGVRSSARTERIGAVAVAALLLAGGLAVYPHMVLASSLVLLPIAAIAIESWRALLRRVVLTALVYGGALVVAAVVVPGLISDAIDNIRELADIEAGWRIPSIFPTEMLGFQSDVGGPQSPLTVVMSGIVLAALAVAAVVAWRRGLAAVAAPLVVAFAVVLLTYVVVYVREGGPTYQQWKWITFFTPLAVAAAIALVLLAVFEAVKPPDRGRRVGYTALGAYIAISVLAFAPSVAFPLRAAPNSYQTVTPDLADTGVNPRLDGIEKIHLNTQTWWETMWLDYFLRDKITTASLATYYPASEPDGEWYIERNDQPPMPGAELIQLNDTYRLARLPSASSGGPEPPDQSQATGTSLGNIEDRQAAP